LYVIEWVFFVVVGCDAFKRATKFETKSLTILIEISVFFCKNN
jgi:hypothetical protein